MDKGQHNRSKLRLATRGSALALAQAREVIADWRKTQPQATVDFELVVVKTTGDRQSEGNWRELPGYGHFTRAVDLALLEGTADFAVHSLKDLPVAANQGTLIAAIARRDSAEDVLITRDGSDLADLPKGAAVATGSLRRTAQLLRLRPDLRVQPVRGNIDRRLARLSTGEWDALVLAEAGLRRLGLSPPQSPLGSVFLPAAGQGALALTVAADNRELADWLAAIQDSETACLTTAERAFLQGLNAGCHAAVGVRARLVAGERLHLEGAVWSADGRVEARAAEEFAAAEPLAAGLELAQTVRAAGGERLLSAASHRVSAYSD